jgi:hypothetical protein
MQDFNPMLHSSAAAASEAMVRIRSNIDAAAESVESKTARRAVRHLMDQIVEFEKTLDASSDVGMRLVSFGSASVFRVTALGCVQPDLIVFEGEMEGGQPVRLIQHVSQLSFLLTRVPRPNPEAPRPVIGFHAG